MAAKPETTFTNSVHRHLPPVSELYRMKNNNQFISGIPDFWYSGNDQDLWVEYKFLVLPKRDSTIIDLVGGKDPPLSALQQAWIRDRRTEGRNVWVIVGCKEGGVVFVDQQYTRPVSTGLFRSWIMDRATVAQRIVNFVS